MCIFTDSNTCIIILKTGQQVLCNIFENKEKNRVRAVAVGCETLAYESFDNSNIFRAISDMEIAEGSRLEQNLFMEDSYVGTANLNPEDTYDYETGKKIAVAKLIAKLEKAIMGRRKMLARELRATADRLEVE